MGVFVSIITWVWVNVNWISCWYEQSQYLREYIHEALSALHKICKRHLTRYRKLGWDFICSCSKKNIVTCSVNMDSWFLDNLYMYIYLPQTDLPTYSSLGCTQTYPHPLWQHFVGDLHSRSSSHSSIHAVSNPETSRGAGHCPGYSPGYVAWSRTIVHNLLHWAEKRNVVNYEKLGAILDKSLKWVGYGLFDFASSDCNYGDDTQKTWIKQTLKALVAETLLSIKFICHSIYVLSKSPCICKKALGDENHTAIGLQYIYPFQRNSHTDLTCLPLLDWVKLH